MTEDESFYLYTLKQCRDSNTIVSLYIYPDEPEEYISGFVIDVTQTEVLILALTSAGIYDGYCAIKLSCIRDLYEETDDYGERLKLLIKKRHKKPSVTVEPQEDESFVHAVCRTGIDNSRMVSLLTVENEYTGHVAAYDDEHVMLLALDYFGTNPMGAKLPFANVLMASIGGEYEEVYELLSPFRLIRHNTDDETLSEN